MGSAPVSRRDDRAGHIAHWPGGLVLAFPAAGTVRAPSCSRPETSTSRSRSTSGTRHPPNRRRPRGRHLGCRPRRRAVALVPGALGVSPTPTPSATSGGASTPAPGGSRCPCSTSPSTTAPSCGPSPGTSSLDRRQRGGRPLLPRPPRPPHAPLHRRPRRHPRRHRRPALLTLHPDRPRVSRTPHVRYNSPLVGCGGGGCGGVASGGQGRADGRRYLLGAERRGDRDRQAAGDGHLVQPIPIVIERAARAALRPVLLLDGDLQVGVGRIEAHRAATDDRRELRHRCRKAGAHDSPHDVELRIARANSSVSPMIGISSRPYDTHRDRSAHRAPPTPPPPRPSVSTNPDAPDNSLLVEVWSRPSIRRLPPRGLTPDRRHVDMPCVGQADG